ncbi:MAG: alpha/beta hydrolase fold domain-containing protein [Gemmatimonadota bacterium]|nr:alpha/beta hydrolase fold domain-containing protein [Gemmatimonadota bacterium]
MRAAPTLPSAAVSWCLCTVAFAGPASPMSAQELIGVADALRFESPEPDHRIAYGSHPLQFGNLRLPAGDGPHPVVALVHGGCWLSMFDLTYMGQAEQAMADAGFAVWSIEYRRVGDEGGGWPATYLDVGSGFDHLRELSGLHDLDLTRVVAAGHSAGGALALWAAARDKIDSSSELYVDDPVSVQAVFALAPAADLEGLHTGGTCGNVVGRLMGGSSAENPDRYAAASPMQLAPVGVPQTLLIGGLDTAWGPPGRAYYNRAITAGDSGVRVVDLPESGHFEMVVPTTSTWPLVIAALEDTFAGLESGN